MAITPRTMVATATRPASSRTVARRVDTKVFAESASTAFTIPSLSPVAYNTSTGKWGVWANAGTNGMNKIQGFASLKADISILASGGGDVIAEVITRGEVHYNDIVLPGGETAANLKAALRATGADNLRQKGLDITGLDQIS